MENVLIPRQHFAQSLMVSVAISETRKTYVIFVDNNINSEIYQRNMLSNMLQQIKEVCDDYTLQQDGAACHTSQQTISFLQNKGPCFIEPEDWSPNSP